uniref:Endonuclease/exonuclease/phosphatase domain-containing protein n=1 Tax=Cacopsylla melanoneura TaxID=428564 RepID=A0A8D8QZ65_9HEMI
MRGKLKTFMCNVNLCNFDVLLFTESWLCESIYNKELGISSSYNIYRCDRSPNHPKKIGGGTLITAHKKYKSQIIKISNLSVKIETVFVLVKLQKCNLIVNATYIPPESPIELYENYVKILDEVLSKYPNSLVLIAGDFNLKYLKWSRNVDTNYLEFSNSNTISDVLLNATNLHGLWQINDKPNSYDRFLDLVFINFDHLDLSVSDDPMLSPSIRH